MKSGLFRFNRSARRILALAHAEAEGLSHLAIEQEHILLALLQDDGAAGNLLGEQGASVEGARQVLDRLTPASRKSNAKGRKIDLGETTQQVLEQAVELARQNAHKFIAPEHLLLAPTMRKETRIREVMKETKLDRERIRKGIEQLLPQLKAPQELDDLLETLEVCWNLLRTEADSIHRERLQRIEQILMEYFSQP